MRVSIDQIRQKVVDELYILTLFEVGYWNRNKPTFICVAWFELTMENIYCDFFVYRQRSKLTNHCQLKEIYAISILYWMSDRQENTFCGNDIMR